MQTITIKSDIGIEVTIPVGLIKSIDEFHGGIAINYKRPDDRMNYHLELICSDAAASAAFAERVESEINLKGA